MKIYLLLTFVVASLQCTYAQSITCADFSITNMYPDNFNPGDYQVTIYFNSDQTMFANYPYISVLQDCQGDTIATGSMFYFGQLGQTSQDYPVTPTTTTWCEPVTAILIYGNDLGETDTCLLTFENSGIVSKDPYDLNGIAYPNPFQNHIVTDISNTNRYFTLSDGLGKVVWQGKQPEEQDFSNLPEGVYLLRTEGYSIKMIKN